MMKEWKETRASERDRQTDRQRERERERERESRTPFNQNEKQPTQALHFDVLLDSVLHSFYSLSISFCPPPFFFVVVVYLIISICFSFLLLHSFIHSFVRSFVHSFILSRPGVRGADLAGHELRRWVGGRAAERQVGQLGQKVAPLRPLGSGGQRRRQRQ